LEHNVSFDPVFRVISFLREWALWDGVQIHYGGMCFSGWPHNGAEQAAPGIWHSPSACDISDTFRSCYMRLPEAEPAMVILCEGAPLQDILSGRRETMGVFQLPYHRDRGEISRFRERFYGLLEGFGFRWLPLGMYWGIVCMDNKDESGKENEI